MVTKTAVKCSSVFYQLVVNDRKWLLLARVDMMHFWKDTQAKVHFHVNAIHVFSRLLSPTAADCVCCIQ